MIWNQPFSGGGGCATWTWDPGVSSSSGVASRHEESRSMSAYVDADFASRRQALRMYGSDQRPVSVSAVARSLCPQHEHYMAPSAAMTGTGECPADVAAVCRQLCSKSTFTRRLAPSDSSDLAHRPRTSTLQLLRVSDWDHLSLTAHAERRIVPHSTE